MARESTFASGSTQATVGPAYEKLTWTMSAEQGLMSCSRASLSESSCSPLRPGAKATIAAA